MSHVLDGLHDMGVKHHGASGTQIRWSSGSYVW